MEFEWGDVFSDAYGLPTETSAIWGLRVGREDKVGGLRSMLLRWYGIARPDEEGERRRGDDDSGGPESVLVDDGGDNVDRVAEVPKVARGNVRTLASDREKKRALGLVRRIATRLGEADYLGERAPEVLAADLRIAAVLLRVGLAEGWLAEEEFVDGTMEIWAPLFFRLRGGRTGDGLSNGIWPLWTGMSLRRRWDLWSLRPRWVVGLSQFRSRRATRSVHFLT